MTGRGTRGNDNRGPKPPRLAVFFVGQRLLLSPLVCIIGGESGKKLTFQLIVVVYGTSGDVSGGEGAGVCLFYSLSSFSRVSRMGTVESSSFYILYRTRTARRWPRRRRRLRRHIRRIRACYDSASRRVFFGRTRRHRTWYDNFK